MMTILSSLKSAALAVAVSAGLTLPTLASPAGMIQPVAPVVKTEPSQATPVRERCNDGRCFGNRHWRGGDRNWRHGRDWRRDRDWRWRNHHRRDSWRGSGIYLGLGFGVPAYRYYAEPRRTYRTTSLSRAHVNWCFSHYRTYRAWDNTYVPRRGVRAQCWSPYS